jgi:hypothetical protein
MVFEAVVAQIKEIKGNQGGSAAGTFNALQVPVGITNLEPGGYHE